MTFTLERMIYGNADSSGELTILGISDHLTPQDSALWRGITSLKPLAASTFLASRSFGLFAGPEDRFVFACAYNHAEKPYFEYVLLPRQLLTELAGDLAPLLALFDQPVDEESHAARIAPLDLPDVEAWQPAQRRAAVDALLDQVGGMDHALKLLGAALHERGLLIQDYPADMDARLALIEGLIALLPARVRPDLTFSTNRHEQTLTQARLVFASSNVVTGRWVANWATQEFPGGETETIPYVRRLTKLWAGDVQAFLDAIDQMDALAVSALTKRNLQNSLTVIAERHALDAQIRAGEDVSPEALKAVMKDIPPQGDLKRLYVKRLLKHALAERDTDAAQIVARVMDEDPALDRKLFTQLQRDLATRPDAVYSFIRARLSAAASAGEEAEEGAERWADRLKIAALASLRVAILDGDAETAINWLRLIAREPASYDLGEIVHNSILSAQERAHAEPELAQALILLAVKRDPVALEALLADEALLAALPNGIGTALRAGEGDPLQLLQTYGVEVFLLALTRALAAQQPDLFTPEAIEQVWTLAANGGANGSAASAERILDDLSSGAAVWLPTLALATLIELALRDRRDDLAHQIAHQVSGRDDFLTVLIAAITDGERSDSETLALIAQMISVGDLTQQTAVDLYVGLLAEWDWRDSAIEVMEQLARAIQQHADIEVEPVVIWHLLAIASELKEDLVIRVALRRLTADLETIDDEELLADDLQRVIPLIAGNAAARTQLLLWWRGFVREQTTARLQRLDKALVDNSAESKRTQEDLRTIVQTVIAFRRMLGKRSLPQFAEDVGTAYAILQGLVESFDPSAKRAVSFDPSTIRLELDARSEELSPHELKILANNFKELAQIVTEMADNRSKATLMRRGDDVDRQLMTGEQQPHSAVDALKWMSGYLSGTQEKPDEAEE